MIPYFAGVALAMAILWAAREWERFKRILDEAVSLP